MGPFERNVSSQYGAPMGRRESTFESGAKVRPARVRLDAGGYDKGGAYWGGGRDVAPRYCAWDDDGNTQYVRASSRDAAKRKLPADLRYYR